MDKLLIRGLIVQCQIGVTEAERAKRQTIRIDLELGIDAASAAAEDDLRKAIDYARLVDVVRQQAESHPLCLLETLAERIASTVLDAFHPDHVQVRVSKRALPGIDDATIEIRRPRQGQRLPTPGA